MAVAALKIFTAAALLACALILVSYSATSVNECQTAPNCNKMKGIRLNLGRKLTLQGTGEATRALDLR